MPTNSLKDTAINPPAVTPASGLASSAFASFAPHVAHPLIIAHRGASTDRLENTLAAFRRALDLRVDGIELDVRVTRDGVPEVFHDPTLKRLAGLDRRIASLSWREIQKLHLAGGEKIPRLAEVLRLTRGRAVVEIEIKSGVPVGPVIRAVRTTGTTTGVILASFSPALLRKAARLAPSVPRMLISSGTRPARDLLRQLAALGAAGMSVDQHAVKSAAYVRFFQSRGYSVWCWTVNRPSAMRRLARYGVNALLSDDPALLQRTLPKG